MLTIWGEQQRFCDGVTRRGFLKVGAFGAGLTLTEMLRLRASASDLPPFVSLRGSTVGTEPGYLGVGHRPFTPDGPGINNLRLAQGVNAKSVTDRKSLLHNFDSLRRDIDASETMRGMDTF